MNSAYAIIYAYNSVFIGFAEKGALVVYTREGGTV